MTAQPEVPLEEAFNLGLKLYQDNSTLVAEQTFRDILNAYRKYLYELYPAVNTERFIFILDKELVTKKLCLEKAPLIHSNRKTTLKELFKEKFGESVNTA